MFVEQGGEGADLLLLLHGMGATASVWSPLCAQVDARWAGRWMALDLPGHGGSEPAPGYAIGLTAAAVAQAVLPHIHGAGRLVVLGHSLGGVIALALATGWFGLVPHRVFAAGIKVAWSDDELHRMAALAAQPARHFATEDEARERYLKVSGLAGLVDATSPVAGRGVRRDAEGWRLAMDPRAYAVGRPPVAELMRLARCPAHLGRGEQDAMVTSQQLREIDPDAVELGPHGHNVMIEAPARMWDWIAAG
ncbi:MAG: alpha/beta hydrolase [Gammaproteobacteria bacterium]|nr:alpha/beta hydrolase [Gammaproteobacteria bacterium]MBU1444129.1 alpha/beta hydrolase [Gammaproteobacteria bacterium]